MFAPNVHQMPFAIRACDSVFNQQLNANVESISPTFYMQLIGAHIFHTLISISSTLFRCRFGANNQILHAEFVPKHCTFLQTLRTLKSIKYCLFFGSVNDVVKLTPSSIGSVIRRGRNFSNEFRIIEKKLKFSKD